MLAMNFAISCTKKLPYKDIYKDNIMDKSLFDTNSLYIYTPSSGSTSRTSQDARPFFLGETKLVKLRFLENQLVIYEIEKDDRFAENTSNAKMIMQVPVTHVDYECAKDRYGECTGAEQESTNVNWQSKTKLKADFGNVKITEPNLLPLELENSLGIGACHQEKAARLVDLEITNNAINFRLEKTFNTSLMCLGALEEISDITTTAEYHYSLVKLDTLASANYKSILYPPNDHGIFGFFTTEQRKVDIDNRNTQKSEVTYLNRWNPEKTEIIYYLSDNFIKPENTSLKKATFEAIEKINSGLSESGAKLKIKLQNPEGKLPGDIRNNMIVLVEDPSAAGLLGYGPSVTNPLTGEILSARTVMYSGIMKTVIRSIYEEVRAKALSEPISDIAKAPLAKTGIMNSANNVSQNLAFKKGLSIFDTIKTKIETINVKQFAKSKSQINTPINSKILFPSKRKMDLYSDLKANPMSTYMAKQGACLFTVDELDISKIILKLQGKMSAADLKPWTELSDNEKQQIIELILPDYWTTTLVHELGHNLGLRHNFGGSEDRDNFYTIEELKKDNINYPITSSTVMEYTGSEFAALPKLGKYDVAALRFAYSREVYDSAGNVHRIGDGESLTQVQEKIEKNSPKDENGDPTISLRPYKFCTDEHADLNIGCKRFDQGTSYSEIAQYLVKQYYDRSRISNYRGDALRFSLLNDASYAARLEQRTFHHLRLFLDVLEKQSKRVPLDNDLWVKLPLLKDIRQAANISYQFFSDVITTPDKTCLLVDLKEQNGGLITAKLGTHIPMYDVECSSKVTEKLNINQRKENGVPMHEYKMMGQFGRHFKSAKLVDSDNHYMDQIDVRGIWIDKVMALKYLISRSPRISLKSTSFETDINYGELPEISTSYMELIVSILLNSLEKEVPVEFYGQGTKNFKLPIKMFDEQLIEKPINSTISKFLSIPYDKVYLQEVLISELKKDIELRQKFTPEKSNTLYEFIRAYQEDLVFGQAEFNIKSLPTGSEFIATSGKILAATPNNLIAHTLIRYYKAALAISKLPEEKLEPIITAREGKTNVPTPNQVSNEEKLVWEISDDVFAAIVFGSATSDPQSYLKLLMLLPN